MTGPGPVLRQLAQAVSDQLLYGPDHPATEQRLEVLWERIREACDDEGELDFSFLDHRVVEGDQPLGTWDDWPVAGRLASAGLRRLSFSPGIEEDEVRGFVNWVVEQLRRQDERGWTEPPGWPHIECGDVTVESRETRSEEELESFDEGRPLELDVEVEVTRALFEQAGEQGQVEGGEAQAVIRALSVVLDSGGSPLVAVSKVNELDAYTTVHSLNVSLLTMSLAERIGYGSSAVYQLGVCGLLHDVGKQRVPMSILTKDSGLNDDEWAEIEKHPAEGARILLRSGSSLEAPAVVAYEHHMQGTDGGYPERSRSRPLHEASRIVQVCDIFDALGTHRAHRAALSTEEALTVLTDEAGPEGPDPDLVAELRELVEQSDPRIAVEEPEAMPA